MKGQRKAGGLRSGFVSGVKNSVLVGEEKHCVLCEQVAKLMVSF